MVRIALVDDDKEHLETMKMYLERYSREDKWEYSVTEFHNGLNFVEDFDGNIDIVFLDIEMPHLDGIAAARAIRKKAPSMGIVFITNMAQYAIKGYEVDAIDFIVKPIGYYIFVDKLKKAMRFVEKSAEKEIIIEADDSVVRLKLARISYIEKEKNYLIYHTDQTTYRIRGTMAKLEKTLGKEGFSKCISGCLVNLKHVTQIGKDTIELDSIQLPLSRQRKKEFKEDFMKYIGSIA